MGTAMIQFCQYFGGTVFLSIAKSVFENRLVPALHQYAPAVNPGRILNSGSTQILQGLSPSDGAGVLTAYNAALVATYVSLISSIRIISKHEKLIWKIVVTRCGWNYCFWLRLWVGLA